MSNSDDSCDLINFDEPCYSSDTCYFLGIY